MPNGGSDSGRLEGDKAEVKMGEEQAAVVVLGVMDDVKE